MKKALLLAIAAAFAVSACSSPQPNSSTNAPKPGPRDESVAAALPVGAFDVIGAMALGSGTTAELRGFVDFGTEPDGTGCSSEETIEAAEPSPGKPSRVQSLHPVGGPSWSRDASDLTKPGPWIDIADPRAPGVVFSFVPAIIASEFSHGILPNAGTGVLCSIPVMPRFMRADGGSFVFDEEAMNAAIAARAQEWADSMIEAFGPGEEVRDKIRSAAKLMTVPAPEMLTKATAITIAPNADGSFSIYQRNVEERFSVEMILTPTTTRAVETPDAPTYFERITADVAKRGANTVLNELGLG